MNLGAFVSHLEPAVRVVTLCGNPRFSERLKGTVRQVEPPGGLVTLSISLLTHICPWKLFCLRKQIWAFAQGLF